MDQKYVAQVEYLIGEIEKQTSSKKIDEVYRLFTMNSDKIMPRRLLARCAQVLLVEQATYSTDNIDNAEKVQAKFMAVILREFRKNIEYTKFLEKKKEEIMNRQKNATGLGTNKNAAGRKPIVNDLFNNRNAGISRKK